MNAYLIYILGFVVLAIIGGIVLAVTDSQFGKVFGAWLLGMGFAAAVIFGVKWAVGSFADASPVPEARGIQCIQCGESADTPYCGNCGEKIIYDLVCPECGNPTETNFCGECGTKVR